MNCAQFDWLVADIAAGRIEAGAEVRAHLARCDRCRAHLQAERRLTAALRDVAAELAPLSAPPAVEAA
ncbi:MAG: anti-sigma factor, partial [Gammaproteobacteria bacterium]